ncbi:hypothetical protein RF55_17325, partial [Lasius niger]
MVSEHTECRGRSGDMESSPKDQIQYGGDQVSREKYDDVTSVNKVRIPRKMDYQKQIEKLREEESVLLRRIEKRIWMQGIIKKQQQRINMLRSLAGEEENDTSPTPMEVEKISKKESDRSAEVSRKVFLALQAVSTEDLTLTGNTMDGEISCIEDEEEIIPCSLDKVIDRFRQSNVKKGKENKLKAAKPKIISDLRAGDETKEISDKDSIDREIAKLQEKLSQAQRKRSSTFYKEVNDHDDKHNHSDDDFGKGLPRNKKSRRSPLAGVMKPKVPVVLTTMIPAAEETTMEEFAEVLEASQVHEHNPDENNPDEHNQDERIPDEQIPDEQNLDEQRVEDAQV